MLSELSDLSQASLTSGGAGVQSHPPRWGSNKPRQDETNCGSGGGGHTVGITGIHRRGSLQLWQFLLALLNDPVNHSAIVWTGRGMEFKLIEPEEVFSLTASKAY